MAQLDENKLNAFIGKMLGDLGGAFSVPTVRVGLTSVCSTLYRRAGPRRPMNWRNGAVA